MTDLRELALAAKAADDTYRATWTQEDGERVVRARYALFDAATAEAILALYAGRDEARKALERIRGLDEADGHNLTWGHAAEAVAIAAEALSARETPANA